MPPAQRSPNARLLLLAAAALAALSALAACSADAPTAPPVTTPPVLTPPTTAPGDTAAKPPATTPGDTAHTTPPTTTPPATGGRTAWRAGAAGDFRAAANWSAGAPGAGATAVLAGAGTNAWLFAPSANPLGFRPNAGRAGYTLDDLTLELRSDASNTRSRPVRATLSNTTLGAGASVRAAGSGYGELSVWGVNRIGGPVDVAPGDTLLVTQWTDYAADGTVPPASVPVPTTTLAGAVTVNPDAALWLQPLVGGVNTSLHVWLPNPDSLSTYYGSEYTTVNPFHGWGDFANAGQVSVAPGGLLLDRGLNPQEGLYFHDFINTGTIRARGAAGKKTAVVLDANVRGGGTIEMDGGGGDPSQTQLALFGPLLEGNVVLRGASLYMADGAQHVVRAKPGASITFADAGAYLFLKPSLNRGEPVIGRLAGTGPSLLEPFGATIKGFRAGNKIAFAYTFAYTADPERIVPEWDQASHTLTVRSLTKNLVLARFTLDGTYDAGEFRVHGWTVPVGGEVPGYLYPQPGIAERPMQVYVTTTHGG